MLILGINGGFRQGYQDVSACLVENGTVLAAVEEERLNRIKFSAGRLPYLSILEVLKITGKTIQDVDTIAYHGSTWEAEIEGRIEDYFRSHFGYSPAIKRFHHHDCHAASSFYASDFDEALIVTLDSSGDGTSLQISQGKSNKIEVLERFLRPNSIGIFYSLITQYCGFTKESDEYKLMGLSSYGNGNAFDFSWLIDFKNGKLIINQDYLISIPPKTPAPHRDEMLFNQNFINKLGKEKRIPKSEMDPFYMDVAASAQGYIEKIMIKIVRHYLKQTSLKNLCLAGGAALNCVMNQKLMNLPEVQSIFVQPASSDAGVSLGAAWLESISQNIIPNKPENYYLSHSFSNAEIEKILQLNQVKYEYVQNPETIAAKYIANNKVVGWFQGSMEFGPRALGNRSILANPTNPEMKEIVNKKIKFRESFRPFCPSVLEEDAHLYFEGKQNIAPYMNITYTVNEHGQKVIPAVCHIDNTARIQTVNKNQNQLFYNLLKEIKKEIGVGVLLNTSFNLSHEPIVYSPRDALATFYACGLDVLFLGNFKIYKT